MLARIWMPGILRSPGNGLAVSSRIDWVVELLCMSPRKTPVKAHHELCMRMWCSLFFLTAETQKRLWCPLLASWINTVKYGHTTKQFTPVKNMWNLAALANMGTSENRKVVQEPEECAGCLKKKKKVGVGNQKPTQHCKAIFYQLKNKTF